MRRRGFLTIASVGCGAVALAGLGRAGQVGLLSVDESKEAWGEFGRKRGLRAAPPSARRPLDEVLLA